MDNVKKRDDIINTLQQEIEDEEFPPSSMIYNSWVRGEYELSSNDDSSIPTKQCRFFDKHGFILIPNFASSDEISNMKSNMEQIVNDEWHPSKHESTEVFRTDDKQCDAQGKSNYFLDSANKVHFFGETSAVEESGELKEEYKSNKLTALNKSGHGIHTRPSFKEYTQSNKVSKLLRDLGWKAPVVPQESPRLY